MTVFKYFAPFALASLVGTVVTTPAARSAADTVVIVVRHAEKAGPSGDVPLSPEGVERARALVNVARQAGVSGIITTQFQRTRQTAAPLAESLGIAPQVVEATGAASDHARAVVDAIQARYTGRTVLVVGHSNTVPAIVAALGVPPFPDLCDEEYDNLFTVIVSPDGSARVVRAKYGATSQLTAACGLMAR